MFDNFIMAANHARRPMEEDTIFRINREAGEAAKKYGRENIINATVGSILKDDGSLAVLPSVIETLKSLDNQDYCAYAPIAGLPEFLETAKEAAFKGVVKNGFMEAVATPGGTGAIRHTIYNYTEPGDTVLTADWYWGPYKNIAEEHDRHIDTFTLFNDGYKFNIDSFRDKVKEIVERQKSIVILLNFPGNNPTGYNLDSREWDEIIGILKQEAEWDSNRIVVFIDMAYIDYSGDTLESRQFIKKFENLPENILPVFGFSMSKGYTLYGMRSGAMICLSSSEAVAREFRVINEHSNRCTWSNGTRPAMVVLNKIFKDGLLLKKVEEQRNELKELLSNRATAFMEESKNHGLDICPYKSGFFISIPCSNSKVVAEGLKEFGIYAVPVKKGLRFAICSVPEEKCRLIPSKIVKVLKTLR